jgi:hypothetical protein
LREDLQRPIGVLEFAKRHRYLRKVLAMAIHRNAQPHHPKSNTKEKPG